MENVAPARQHTKRKVWDHSQENLMVKQVTNVSEVCTFKPGAYQGI